MWAGENEVAVWVPRDGLLILRFYDEVNAFKHVPKGIAKGRKVQMEEDVIKAFEQMLYLLQKGKAALSKRYKRE